MASGALLGAIVFVLWQSIEVVRTRTRTERLRRGK